MYVCIIFQWLVHPHVASLPICRIIILVSLSSILIPVANRKTSFNHSCSTVIGICCKEKTSCFTLLQTVLVFLVEVHDYFFVLLFFGIGYVQYQCRCRPSNYIFYFFTLNWASLCTTPEILVLLMTNLKFSYSKFTCTQE